MLTGAKLSNMKLFFATINDKNASKIFDFPRNFRPTFDEREGIMLGNLYRTGLYGNAENQSN